MNRLIILVVTSIIVVASVACAQAYRPFLSNTRWFNYVGFIDGDFVYHWSCKEIDTVIFDRVYAKINRSMYDRYTTVFPSMPCSEDHNSTGYFREDTISQKVYAYSTVDRKEYVLYDFRMPVGGKLPSDSNWVLTTIDSALYPDGYHKRLQFTSVKFPTLPPTIWIEGLGDLHDPIAPGVYTGGAILCEFENANVTYDNGAIKGFECASFVRTVDVSPTAFLPLGMIVRINPGDNRLVVEYTHPTTASVTIVVTDAIGRQVYERAEENNQLAGRYSELFPVESQRSGIFFVVLSVDGKIATRSVAITK